jgi:hypothetical protein
LFQLHVFPDFPKHLDHFQYGESIAHVENPDTFQVGHENNKRMLFMGAYSALIKEEIQDESVLCHYFNMKNPPDCILFAFFQRDVRGYKSMKTPTLSFLQRRCLIREVINIATAWVSKNRKGKNTRFQVTLNDIELAIHNVLSMKNNDLRAGSLSDNNDEDAKPAANQQDPAASLHESNSSDDQEKQLPSKKNVP